VRVKKGFFLWLAVKTSFGLQQIAKKESEYQKKQVFSFVMQILHIITVSYNVKEILVSGSMVGFLKSHLDRFKTRKISKAFPARSRCCHRDR
jgi:hypothetical protein